MRLGKEVSDSWDKAVEGSELIGREKRSTADEM